MSTKLDLLQLAVLLGLALLLAGSVSAQRGRNEWDDVERPIFREPHQRPDLSDIDRSDLLSRRPFPRERERRQPRLDYGGELIPDYDQTGRHQGQCPPGTPQVRCFADPCSVNRCPAYPHARCVSNYCGSPANSSSPRFPPSVSPHFSS